MIQKKWLSYKFVWVSTCCKWLLFSTFWTASFFLNIFLHSSFQCVVMPFLYPGMFPFCFCYYEAGTKSWQSESCFFDIVPGTKFTQDKTTSYLLCKCYLADKAPSCYFLWSKTKNTPSISAWSFFVFERKLLYRRNANFNGVTAGNKIINQLLYYFGVLPLTIWKTPSGAFNNTRVIILFMKYYFTVQVRPGSLKINQIYS